MNEIDAPFIKVSTLPQAMPTCVNIPLYASGTLENEMRQMRETITHTLKEYEVTVKNQGQRISELEAETKTLYSLNQELEERNGEWEIKLTRANSAKDSLNLKVIQLSDQLEGRIEVIKYV